MTEKHARFLKQLNEQPELQTAVVEKIRNEKLNSEKAGNLTLYPHKEEEFWLWVASWAVFIQRPSDLA